MNQEKKLNDLSFLISQTDAKGKIIFANDDFCDIAGYEVGELIGKPHSIIRHKDMPKAAFKDLWDTIQRGETWTGYVKNAAKNGDYYWVFATVYPLDVKGERTYLSCRRKAAQKEIDKHAELYKKMIKEEKK